MMTGRLVASKGSLARAVQPLVWGVKWGWHRAHRAMERGKIKIDEMLEQMNQWCIEKLEVEEIRIGEYQREVIAVDTSTIARLRSGSKLELAACIILDKSRKSSKVQCSSSSKQNSDDKRDKVRVGRKNKIKY